MKRSGLTCLLLSLCAMSSVAGPAPQSSHQTLGESKCNSGFRECKESLIDFKQAQQFMQLKAAVYADLNRLEKSRSIKPKIATVHDADVNRHKTGSGAVYSATVERDRKTSVQAPSAKVSSYFTSIGSGRSNSIDPANQSRPSVISPSPTPRLLLVLDHTKASAKGDD